MVSEVNIGQLIDFDWKVSMACTSNHCKNVDAPVVTVKFQLKDESNEPYSKTIEMSLAQFQVIFYLLHCKYKNLKSKKLGRFYKRSQTEKI